MVTEASSPFFSPINESEVERFDYRKLLILVGANLPDIFTDSALRLLHREELIYQAPCLEFDASSKFDRSPVSKNITITTFIPSEIKRFERITIEINNENGLPELAFLIRMRDDNTVLMSESDCVRIFSNSHYSPDTGKTMSFSGILDMLAFKSLYEFRRDFNWPRKISKAALDHISPMNSSRGICAGYARAIGEEIAHLNNLPFMNKGKVCQPLKLKIEVPDVPELAKKSAIEESRKLNPTFGALSLLRGSK